MKRNSLVKKISLVVLSALFLALLCACSKGVGYDSATESTVTGGSSYNSAASDMKFESVVEMDDTEVMEEATLATPGAAEAGSGASQTDASISEKIIYSANAYVETTEFDAAIEEVYFMVDSYGGFIEGSYISGANYSTVYYGRQTYRNAWFTIRIPVASFADVSGSLDRFGYVTGIETCSDNITTKFYDTQTRLNAYKAEHERLVELLDKAENVDELIYIEQRLSEVQYSIDSLSSTLKNWQNEVDYSTLHLYIDEVAVIRVTPQVTETYWQQMATGIKDTLTGIGEFFKDLLMWFVVSLPIIAIFAVIIITVILFVRAKRKKLREKNAYNNYPSQHYNRDSNGKDTENK